MSCVIVADENDSHAALVQRLIGQSCHVVDSSDFPSRIHLSYAPKENERGSLVTSKGVEIRIKDITGIWWRRPHRHRIHREVADQRVRQFCFDEARMAFQGLVNALASQSVNVINDVKSEAAANQKPYQLTIANKVGLTIPKTLITNDPIAARTFREEVAGSVVFKVLTGTSWQFAETRPFDTATDRHLDSLKYAPCIFQERIAGTNVRVNVIDNDVFAAELRSAHPDAQLDWRLDQGHSIEPLALPAAISSKLIELNRALGLRFGAMDLIRRSDDGSFVFLETNPSGQWLFVEIHAGLPIAAAIATALTRRKVV